MGVLPEFAISFLIALGSGAISLLIKRITSSVKREEAAKRTVALKVATEAQANIARQALSGLPEETLERYLQYLVYSQRPDGSFPEPPIVFTPPVDLSAVEEIVEARYSVLQKRVEEIDKRFPREATLEKIASVNDAILATNLESIAETVKRLEEKMLTKWDVAKTVFQILAAVGGLVSLAIAIVNFVIARGTP